MTGLPSQLGYKIIDDICRKPTKLDGCCCAGAALALWSNQLPISIRAHISNSEFTKETYRTVFEAADQVFLSSKQVSVAAVAQVAALDETQSAFSPQNQPQVAAIGGAAKNGSGSGGKKPKKNKNKNQNGGGGAASRSRGQKHHSNPPDSVCDRHYRHGPEAWYCVAPHSCPWKDKTSARP